MRGAALMLSLATLAACKGGAPAEQPVQNDIMVRSEAQQQLFDLNDLDRAIALKRAIADQGLRCARIVSTGYLPSGSMRSFPPAICWSSRPRLARPTWLPMLWMQPGWKKLPAPWPVTTRSSWHWSTVPAPARWRLCCSDADRELKR